MRYEEFVHRVATAANIDGEQAKTITRSVLETLGERLERTHRNHLADQLSEELREMVLDRPVTRRFLLEEFYNRVAARADLRHSPAVRRTKAVMEVLRQAVSEGELEDIRAELPSEYGELFGK
jgi:uncharacterized protein (DUF2267 family)